ncbi:MAG: hypothetical protein IIB14_08885, partial [Chloroflexi bacterium]|nr:hypothetical protein [Chloroflexota bacterium]
MKTSNSLRTLATSSRGFVYAQMTTAVNDGAGTKYSVNVEKPQDVKASLGGKKIRFLSMAARYQSGQILVPGIIAQDGDIVIDPRWETFRTQWGGFPS